MLPRIYLIRHGETEWSHSGQHPSRTDIPLTARGADAARELGQRLRDIRFARVLVTIFIAPCLFCAVEEWKWKRHKA